MDKLVNHIVGKMVLDGTIEQEDSEIYAFGLKQGIIMLINYVLTLLIGVIMHSIVETIIFMAVYIPVRSYAGGVHAKTQARCFVYSNLLIVAILLAIHFCPHSIPLLIALLIFGTVSTFILAPVEDKNKPLDEDEVRIYGRKARIYYSCYVAAAVILILLKIWFAAISVSLTLCLMGIVLILGKYKNYRIDKKM